MPEDGGDQPRRRLAGRLRELRSAWDDMTVTQRQVADALGASPGLVSSWENAVAIPPEDRLKGYARMFATRRSVQGARAQLIPADDLTPDEELWRQQLVDELVTLRDDAISVAEPAARSSGQLRGRFWHFPGDQPINILCNDVSDRQLGLRGGQLVDSAPPLLRYATNPTDPNFISSIRIGDIDALVELVGHLRAENPTAAVDWKRFDQVTGSTSELLSGNVILLGSGDYGVLERDAVKDFMDKLELPVHTRGFQDPEDEWDIEFVVTTHEDGSPRHQGRKEDTYRPRFSRDESDPDRPRRMLRGAPQIDYDIAMIARKPNPLNPSALVVWCVGAFSRGTYGAVRAFTDSRFRARNEAFLSDVLGLPLDDFWMLLQVPVVGRDTVTPDLAIPHHRLRWSS